MSETRAEYVTAVHASSDIAADQLEGGNDLKALAYAVYAIGHSLHEIVFELHAINDQLKALNSTLQEGRI